MKMKGLTIGLFSLAVFFMIGSGAFAAGDVAKGKELFNNPKLAGGTTGKSCSSCHPNGKGLEEAGGRKVWHMMGKPYHTLEGVINYDIETALHGKALDPKSQEMQDLVAYIKSLHKD
jgi:mono/diheme cytochrome c family protein